MCQTAFSFQTTGKCNCEVANDGGTVPPETVPTGALIVARMEGPFVFSRCLENQTKLETRATKYTPRLVLSQH